MARLHLLLFPLFSLSTLTPLAAVDPLTSSDSATGKAAVSARLDSIMAEPKSHERLSKLSDWGAQLSVNEIPEALAATEHLPQWRERAVLRTATLKSWSKLAPADSFAYIAKLPESRLKTDAIHTAAANFAIQNPALASKAASGLSPAASQQEAVGTIAETWAGADVNGALAWVDGMPDGPAKLAALNSILYVWVHKDPAASWKRVQTLVPGDNRSALVTNIAGDWAASDPAAAIQWADGLSDRIERALALQNAAESWANHEPVPASEFVLKMPAGDMRLQAAAAVAAAWGTQNPVQAADWIQEKLDPACQPQAMTRLMMFWAGVDPQASGQWIEKLKAGPVREAAISSYADAASFWTPEQASSLALTLVDESVRQQKLDLCLKRWLEMDHVAMKDWVDNSSMPPELKSRWQMQLAITFR